MNCEIPVENLLGKEGEGFNMSLQTIFILLTGTMLDFIEKGARVGILFFSILIARQLLEIRQQAD
ncbi:MAG: hypothetical protein PF482_00210 [Desulfobacteraceae bacterium]|jgi:hypothetical protein|nr:hypothetical protein [Desulfobacteraceae bacterium]